MSEKPLTGMKVLLLEDEYLIAMMACDMLNDLGAAVIGPASTLEEAHDLIRNEEIDCCVLDVNLRAGTSYSLAEILRARDIPYLFATGYGHADQTETVLAKPYTEMTLLTAIQKVTGEQ